MAVGMDEKICTQCKEKKRDDLFASSGAKGRRAQCKNCWAAYMRKWNARNPEKVAARNKAYKANHPEKYRDSRLRTLFGITSSDYDELYAKQGGCCAACGVHNDALLRNLAVDHCHVSDDVRGLLCSNCNTTLGLVGDSVETLQNLINYLLAKER